MSAVDKPDWSVLTKSRGGTVSLIRNLPLAQAVEVMARLDPHRHMVSGVMYSVNDGDIEQRELIGPGGWDGCTKAMHHEFSEPSWTEVDSGPNKGRFSSDISCKLCGESRYLWRDEQPEVVTA